MREVFVDYNHIGHACRFRTRLFRSDVMKERSAASA